jgi:AAA+ ATPase superfamily predicted ATPase
MFSNRVNELDLLERAYESDRAEFLVVYGRRRTGKTALLHEFCRDKPHVYWTATLSSEALLLKDFTRAIWQAAESERTDPGFVYESWDRAFEALTEYPSETRRVIVIDEFPYLVRTNPGVSTVLQKSWDEFLHRRNHVLILCGSHIGMMEKEVLEYRAPLYGRRTGQLLLQPLPVHSSRDFFPRYSAEDQIRAFAVLGGIPAYLQHFDDRKSIFENIERHILDRNSFLYLEPQFLLREELRDPRNYFAILQAIAHGRTRPNQIAQSIGETGSLVSRYLVVLQELHFVKRRVPITEKRPEKSRKGTYRLSDPFLRFWFRFVAPSMHTLDIGDTGYVLKNVKSELPKYIGPVFEDICRDWVRERGARGELPFTPERVGAWWVKDQEIDVVAYQKDTALVGECKWSTTPVGLNILEELKRKAGTLAHDARWKEIHLALFSRSGFTPDLLDVAKQGEVLLIGPEELLA